MKTYISIGCVLWISLAVAAPPSVFEDITRLDVQAKKAIVTAADASAEAQQLNLRLKAQTAELKAALAVRSAGQVIEAFALRSAIWASNTIAVTWDNPSESNAQERSWVREAVQRTWEKESGLKFVGWTNSTASSKGIRIFINDEGPHCKRLGRHLDGMPKGMVLNITFNNWSPTCRLDRRNCIEKIAVHEFGHAIGFAHEQNRPDAPLECQDQRQGSDGDWPVTVYDPESIMNYCNPKWNNGGFLSKWDIEAARILYGPPDRQ